ncbi:MAG: tetratricopeptide repeat protein [Gammaproteobacteria bacterium]
MPRIFCSITLLVCLFTPHLLQAGATGAAPAEEEAVAEPQEKRGFFSRLFGRGKKDEPDQEATDDDGQDVILEGSLLQKELANPDGDANESLFIFDRLLIEDEPTEADSDATEGITNWDDRPYTENIPAVPAEMAMAMSAMEQSDYSTAFQAFRSMGEQGDAIAMYQVASLYHQGLGTQRDHVEAARWYARAAERGNADAQYRLGGMFLMGEGVTQDDERAEYWYSKAAEQGHDASRHNLGRLKKVMREKREATADGDDDVLPDSGFGGETVISEVAEAGLLDPPEDEPGFFARMFDRDKTAPVPEAAAAADQAGEQTAEKKKPGFFGRIFGGGGDNDDKETPASDDTDQAAQTAETPELSAAVAELEDAFASRDSGTEPTGDDYQIGLAYSLGDGVARDPARAFEHFQRAAADDHTDAQYKLGIAYAYGEGTGQDVQEAINWYEKAAIKGHATAQRNLGMMYLTGEGVTENKLMALAWYSILADSGNPLDSKRRDLLREELSRKEIKEAKKLQAELQDQLQATLQSPEQ